MTLIKIHPSLSHPYLRFPFHHYPIPPLPPYSSIPFLHIAVAGVKGRPREAYFGAVGGGLWKTTDAGNTWAPVTDGQITSSSVGAVAVSESNPDVVYIGMGESCIRGNIMPGDGVYKSTDAGKTWTQVGFADVDAISKIRIHPTNPDIVYVAAFGQYYGAERGARRLQEHRRRQDLEEGAVPRPRTGAVDLAIDANNPNVIYAALWEAYRIEYQMSSGGPGSGLFKSTDGGETWTEITRNPGCRRAWSAASASRCHGADSNRVYALVENENGGLFVSDDAGATWTLMNDNRSRPPARLLLHARVTPTRATRTSSTCSTRRCSARPTAARPSRRSARARTAIITICGSIPTIRTRRRRQRRRRRDQLQHRVARRTWSDQDFPTAQFYHVVTTAHLPFHVCGAQQDNSTLCVPSNTNVGGGGWRRQSAGGRRTRPAAASPATSPRSEPIPTSSSPARTTARS